jgi:replicative DNA helicase Mcm
MYESMTSINKPKTSLTKFEEFFSSKYKNKVLKILEKYPDEKSLVIDFMELKMFDPNLADLLIEKPDDVLQASEKAIKNIDSLLKNVDLNIRIKNLTNSIPLKNLNARYIGKFISVDVFISSIDNPELKLDIGVFECKGCMRLHEVQQGTTNVIVEPSLCTECGGRSFSLLNEESKYLDTQYLTVMSEKTSRMLNIMLKDDLTDYDKYNVGCGIKVTGILKTLIKEKQV